jgi:hypothetical protein
MEVAPIDYMNSKPYLAEKTFGWDRKHGFLIKTLLA